MYKCIKFIGFYSKDAGRVPHPLAAEDKIDYVCSAFENAGYDINFISMSCFSNDKVLDEHSENFLRNSKIFYPKTHRTKGFFSKVFNKIFNRVIFRKWINKNILYGDTVVVYHSMVFIDEVIKLKKKKKIKLVLELEEIYSKIAASKSKNEKKEQKLINLSDSYIFSTNSLNVIFNKNNRPYVVINGVYARSNFVIANKNSSENIRIVYAGSFEKQKGVDRVIGLAEFLPENYEIHIIGFGNSGDIDRVKRLIDSSNQRNKCNVSYDGKKTGIEYTSFLRTCQIGICLQDSDDNFNNFEFPSKIFSYLSHGLYVVCTKLEEISCSDVFPYILSVDAFDLSKTANEIMNIDFNNIKESGEVLEELNKKTIEKIKEMMEELL